MTAPMTGESHDRAVLPAWLEELRRTTATPAFVPPSPTTPTPSVQCRRWSQNTPTRPCAWAPTRTAPSLPLRSGQSRSALCARLVCPYYSLVATAVETPVDQGPVVVCHDGSPAADAILAPARAWARSLNAPIVLMHAHPALDFRAAQESTTAIGRALEFLGPGTCLEEVADSFAAGAIRELAHELDASLIAMSTHGRSALARVVMGKSATWVTRESPCPVLTIRPQHLVR